MPLSLIVIVPARGGSKRIPQKNIAPLLGKPLLQYSFDQIREAGLQEISYISTEDAAIADLCKKEKMNLIDRPAELASDTASTESVLLHALDHVKEKKKVDPEWIMTLPATSPLRTAATIKQFMSEAERASPDVDCLFSVTEQRARFWKKAPDGTMHPVFPDAPPNQQERIQRGEVLFEENSAIYLTRTKALRAAGTAGTVAPIFGERARGITIDPREAIDINTPFDLLIAQIALRSSDPVGVASR